MPRSMTSYNMRRLTTLYCIGILLSVGAEGALSPLNFDNPKRSKIWYVARGAISCRVAAAAKCESAAIDFWIFFLTFFGCCVRYLDL